MLVDLITKKMPNSGGRVVVDSIRQKANRKSRREKNIIQKKEKAVERKKYLTIID